jgi:hypothetical protein
MKKNAGHPFSLRVLWWPTEDWLHFFAPGYMTVPSLLWRGETFACSARVVPVRKTPVIERKDLDGWLKLPFRFTEAPTDAVLSSTRGE